MSMVTAVKYLAEFAAEALRPWDPSRELAARMLADLPLMVRLREDDEATADEVTFLVLGRFAAAEVPTVPGVDFLPGAIIPAEAAPLVALAMAAGMQGRELTAEMLNAAKARLAPDAATLAAEAVAVLDEPKPRQWRDRDGGIWVELPDGKLDLQGVEGYPVHVSRAIVEGDVGPLVEVPAAEVWDGSVPPGGFVCSVCRTPVESEPCELHGEAVES